jgi:hypothetical protein
MITATKDDIGNAIDWEITDWRETQRQAVYNVKFPTIGKNPASDLFKTFSWLNFGVDTTKTLFPDSPVTTLISAASKAASSYVVPLWILGRVQEKFRSRYDEAIANQDVLLGTKFESLRDDFVRHTQDVARNFKNSPFGRAITDKVYNFVTPFKGGWYGLYGAVGYIPANPGREFRDAAERDTYLRGLIHNAGLIVTDPAVIRERTENGFAKLCEKIKNIWLGTRHGPGIKNYLLVSTGARVYRNGSDEYDYKRIRNDEDEDYILANAWRMKDVYHIDEPTYSSGKDRTYATIDYDAKSPETLAETYTGDAIDLEAAERRMNTVRGVGEGMRVGGQINVKQ